MGTRLDGDPLHAESELLPFFLVLLFFFVHLHRFGYLSIHHVIVFTQPEVKQSIKFAREHFFSKRLVGILDLRAASDDFRVVRVEETGKLLIRDLGIIPLRPKQQIKHWDNPEVDHLFDSA